jgi:predicted transcriptional regulator
MVSAGTETPVILLHQPPVRIIIKIMAKAKKFELESPSPILDEEDEETLAAIDEGARDAKAGRIVPAEEARQRLPKWITDSSTPKKR